jgi:hypothetical protein
MRQYDSGAAAGGHQADREKLESKARYAFGMLLKQESEAMSYSRMSAMVTAMVFSDRVCFDGYVASKHGYFGHGKSVNGVSIKPGMLLRDIGAIPRENDCAHFISCCVGDTRGSLEVGPAKVQFRGGGFRLASPIGNGVYGQTHAGRLAATWSALARRSFILSLWSQITKLPGAQFNRS